MFKLFNNQRKITTLLLRASLPAVTSSGLRNTNIFKVFRRSMINNGSDSELEVSPRLGVVPQGHYYVWSLISDREDSLMKLQPSQNHPEIKCNGNFDDVSNLVQIKDASLGASTAMISFQLRDYNEDNFYLSVKHTEDGKYKVVVKPDSERPMENCHRFVHGRWKGFSMFASCVGGDGYLGCKSDGSLVIVHLNHLSQPDPRVLFLIYAKN